MIEDMYVLLHTRLVPVPSKPVIQLLNNPK
jgi:hypothetical protein